MEEGNWFATEDILILSQTLEVILCSVIFFFCYLYFDNGDIKPKPIDVGTIVKKSCLMSKFLVL